MKRGGEVSTAAPSTSGAPFSATKPKHRTSGRHRPSSLVREAALKQALYAMPSCPGRGRHSPAREASCKNPSYVLFPIDMPFGSPGSDSTPMTLSLGAPMRGSLGSRTGTPPEDEKLSHRNEGSGAPVAVRLKRRVAPTAPRSTSPSAGVCPANTVWPRRHPPCTSARTHAGGEHTPWPGHDPSQSVRQRGNTPTAEQGGLQVKRKAWSFDHVVWGKVHVPSDRAARTPGGVWTV
mmetsp:Transcript_33787/g.86588  ORF Transcript_33787/g.86588 Transcript_33787/m.86588 type:complete len:235 (-) Transcript_33787:939-1643(-)